jgi:hypothetical protein
MQIFWMVIIQSWCSADVVGLAQQLVLISGRALSAAFTRTLWVD